MRGQLAFSGDMRCGGTGTLRVCTWCAVCKGFSGAKRGVPSRLTRGMSVSFGSELGGGRLCDVAGAVAISSAARESLSKFY